MPTDGGESMNDDKVAANSSSNDERNKVNCSSLSSSSSSNTASKSTSLTDMPSSSGGVAAAAAAAATTATTTGTKRRRTDLDMPSSSTAADLPIWVAGASPAKTVSLEELMKMSVALENMALVHEIAVNPDFVVEEKRSDPLERAVEETVRKAYWDKFREDFSRDPPDYTHALATLADVKKMIQDLLTPEHVRLNAEVESLLDMDLLKQQLEKKCLDVRQLFENITELLSRMCAPARDGAINDLRKKTDNVDMLRGICELLDLMKVDMANIIVKVNRSVVEQHSAEYEREQFMKVLEKSPDLELSVLNWLQRHVSEGSSSDGPSLAKRRFEDLNNSEVSGIISDAYMELLEWDDQYPYPTTFKIDHGRLEGIAEKYLQLIICTSCILVTCNLVGKDVSQSKDFKTNMKNDVIIITNDINKSNVRNRLEAVSVQCDARASEYCKMLNVDWTKERSVELKEQILAIADCNNHVRKLIRDRIRSFILSMISNPVPSNQQQFAPGLSMMHDHLSAVTALFVRIVNHNRQTFGTYYGELIKKLMNE